MTRPARGLGRLRLKGVKWCLLDVCAPQGTCPTLPSLCRYDGAFRRLCMRPAGVVPMNVFLWDRHVTGPLLDTGMPPTLSRRLFAACDTGGEESLGLEDFMCAMAVITAGDFRERATLLFSTYDSKKDGEVGGLVKEACLVAVQRTALPRAAAHRPARLLHGHRLIRPPPDAGEPAQRPCVMCGVRRPSAPAGPRSKTTTGVPRGCSRRHRRAPPSSSRVPSGWPGLRWWGRAGSGRARRS